MSKDIIHISLNEFMQFIIKPGYARRRYVETVKESRMKDYAPYSDYWKRFRDGVIKLCKGKITIDAFLEMKEDLPDKKIKNYNEAIDGFVTFISRKKITWQTPPRKTTRVSNLRVDVNPEIGYLYKGKVYFVKLFMSSTVTLDRKNADYILSVMEHELRDKVDVDSVFSIIDVKSGRKYDYRGIDKYLDAEVEADSFISYWNKL